MNLANKNEKGKIKSLLQEANSAEGKIIYPWSPKEAEAGEGDVGRKAVFKARRRWV